MESTDYAAVWDALSEDLRTALLADPERALSPAEVASIVRKAPGIAVMSDAYWWEVPGPAPAFRLTPSFQDYVRGLAETE